MSYFHQTPNDKALQEVVRRLVNQVKDTPQDRIIQPRNHKQEYESLLPNSLSETNAPAVDIKDKEF